MATAKLALANKNPKKRCYFRSTCKTEWDELFFNSMFEREWKVFLIRQDPSTGDFTGETICCEEAIVPIR